MVFSDRIERICQNHNVCKLAAKSKYATAADKERARVVCETINEVLATLAIPCVRDTSGYITGFRIYNAVREVRS